MTTITDWIALAESCEMATKPDKWIDEAILKSLGYDFDAVADYHWAWLDRDGGIMAASIPLTASLDQITALIERELPTAWVWTLGQNIHHRTWGVSFNNLGSDGAPYSVCRGASSHTPSLALCAAFCRAMAEKAE